MGAMQIQPGVISNPSAEPARRVILAMMILFSAATHGQQPAQTDAAVAPSDRFIAMQSSALDQEQVVDAMRAMYVAATNDDLALFHSVTDVSGAKDVTWLESAVLRQEQGVWCIQFFHSTRVP